MYQFEELLSNIRSHRRTFSKSKLFVLIEIIAFVGIIILNHFNPSIYFKYKIKS